MQATVFHIGKHLVEAELEPESSVCSFCGVASRKSLFPLQHAPDVFLWECTKCFAASASRMPTPLALQQFYANYYQNVPGRPNPRITFDNAGRFGRHLAAVLAPALEAKELRVLDFGGGDGTVALETSRDLLRKGYKRAEITVVDYNSVLAECDDSRIILTHRDALDDAARPYDVVIASAILEHIPHAAEILNRLKTLTKPGGVFYARTPAVAAFGRLFAMLGLPFDFTFPGHVHDLSQRYWEHAFETGRTDKFRILCSEPSLVETTFTGNSSRTLLAYAVKAPWYVLGRSYPFVGGWEIFAQRV